MSLYQLSETGTEEHGLTRTFVNVTPCAVPTGAYSVSVFTTFSKAKQPGEPQVKLRLHIENQEALHKLADFLKTQ